MKICSVCRTTYDDSQNFCLNDGTPLVNSATEEPRQVEPLEPATVVHASPSTNVSGRESNYPNLSPVTPIVVKKKANTGKIVTLTALATVLLVAVAGSAIYLTTRNRNQPIAQVNDNKNTAKPKNTNVNAFNSNTVLVANNSNAIETNQNSNLANVNANTSVFPSPQPSIKPELATKIRKDVGETLNDWKGSTDDRDLDSHMSFYGENVDYYNAGRVNADKVRADRQKAFDAYNNIEVQLSNVKITPDAMGEKASVILDKSWRFENDEATSEGKVQQSLTMEKLGGRWYITSEKDLKVYYKNKH